MCFCAVQCSVPDANASIVDSSVFDRVWKQNLSVPLLLVVVIFPLINFKSPTFFTKLNALGMNSIFFSVCIYVTDISDRLSIVNQVAQWSPF